MCSLLGYPASSLQGLILAVLAARRLAALDKRTADSLDFFVPTIPVHQRIG